MAMHEQFTINIKQAYHPASWMACSNMTILSILNPASRRPMVL
jgi:hypothetical protein